MTRPFHQTDDVTVYHGDCIEVMRSLPDNSVDSVATDPPYGLEFMGNDSDSPSKLGDVLSNPASVGGFQDGSGGNAFSRSRIRYGHQRSDSGESAFQDWCSAWASEVLRVLKPGGHMIAFGGSRTWHRLATAIEDAGFEIRDSIAWIYATGMPKSLDVAKAIASADAKEWQGWGTNLKPSFEPIVLARKPLQGTVANTVLAHGTGALNIDGCRVAQRWPNNVALDETQAVELDRQSGGDHSQHFPVFKYNPKASSSERPNVDGTTHPTVKPLELMRWLIRLITPPGGVVLEPFAGSGTTIEACIEEHKKCVAIERCDEYLPLIISRITKQRTISFNFDLESNP